MTIEQTLIDKFIRDGWPEDLIELLYESGPQGSLDYCIQHWVRMRTR